jgi:GNAT superfamily N-acetyltransferase
MLEVAPVASGADMREFLRVPWHVYAGDPNWVPPLLAERRHHLSRANPFFAVADVRFLLARRDGAPVGRVSVQVDPEAQPAGGPTVGHFGLLEAVDESTLQALLSAAEDRLRAQGAGRVEGPYSLSINDEVGLLVAGRPSPPRLMMNYAPAWYAAALEAAGYAKAKDLLAYRVPVDVEMPRRAARLAEQAAADPDVVERAMNLHDLDAEMQRVADIFNDAWADNWGFVPMSQADLAYMTKALKPVLNPLLVRLIEVGGDPAAMIVGVPDVNQAIRDLDGRLLPFGWARLLWRLKIRPPRDGRVLLMGVRRRYQDGMRSAGLAALAMQRMIQAARSVGMREMELSWILEDNGPMLRLVELLGAEPDKRYRVYAKTLA